MSVNLLQKWLGLPADAAWPPDDRTLLGLSPGPIDPFLVEKRAMELMDRLRPYQLAHPDLVTEGMTRLAQAMVALSTMTPPATPTPPKPAKKPKETRKTTHRETDKQQPSPPASTARPPVYEAVDFALPDPPPSTPSSSAPILEAEVVEAEVVRSTIPTGYGLAPSPPPVAVPKPEPEPVEAPPIDFAPPAPDGFVVPATGRREAYRNLARLRRLRRAWRKLRSSVADPSAKLDGPAEVCEYLEAVLELREALQAPGTGDDVFGNAGASIRAIVNHPMPLEVFRWLLPSQRQSLARDWAVGLAATETRYGAVRGFLHQDAANRRMTRRHLQMLGRFFVSQPEWVLAGITIVTVGLAAARLLR